MADFGADAGELASPDSDEELQRRAAIAAARARIAGLPLGPAMRATTLAGAPDSGAPAQPAKALAAEPGETAAPSNAGAAESRPVTPAAGALAELVRQPLPERETPAKLPGWKNALGTAATIAADLVSPRLGELTQGWTNRGRQAAANAGYEEALRQRAAEEGELAKAAEIEAPATAAVTGAPKRLDSYVNAEGRHVDVMQNADGTVAERVGGKVQAKQAPAPTLEDSYAAAVEGLAAAEASGDAAEQARQQKLADFYLGKIQQLKAPQAAGGLKMGTLDPGIVGVLGQPPAAGQPGAERYWQRYRQMQEQQKNVGSFANAWVQQASLYYDPATNELLRGTRLGPPPGHRNAVPAGTGELTKAVQARGMINDLAMATTKSSQALSRLDRPFSAAQAAQLKAALTNPNSIAGAAAIEAVTGSLTPAQQEYVRQLQALYEASMSMRNLLGGGRMFEIQANAMQNALPGPTSPNIAYAQGQLQRFRETLGALEAGVPHFAGQENLIPAAGPAAPQAPRRNPYR